MRLFCVPFLLVAFAYGCSSQSTERPNLGLGQYVFMDEMEILHVDKDCPKIMSGKRPGWRSGYGVIFVDTVVFKFPYREIVCANCVSVDDYNRLKAISRRNAHKR